jgi:Protein of unknown function (DUF3710)
MPLFRRKKDEVEGDLGALDEAGRSADVDEEPGAPAGGPWDSASAPADGVQRLDLGSLRVPGFPGMELRLEVDRSSDRVIAATAVSGESQLQMQAFAAPRSGGIWDQVRAEIADGIQQAGGSVEEVEGRFGPELNARVPSEEHSELQPARFVGADGPRWFLRGVFSGSIDAAEVLEDVFAGTVVVRGDQAMAPRDLLSLHLPDEVPQPTQQGSGWSSMDPLRRGPEITEIR